MEQTIKTIAERGRGILAADESTGTIEKRFASIGVENNEENRRAYRELLFTTPGFAEYISGVILFEETLFQKTKDGKPFVELLKSQNVIPGIKVDKGLVNFEVNSDEKVTQGLDGLSERLSQYKGLAQFAKWRAVFNIDDQKPTAMAIKTNANLLARYAAICQAHGIVPIVEPEVLIDGAHSLERCVKVSEHVFHEVFHALHQYGVQLELMILKPNMISSGKEAATKDTPEQVAHATVKALLRTVPAAVPTINFLSGGHSSELSTAYLNAMNSLYPNLPWNLSFSYGRALQDQALKQWLGKAENIEAAQKALFKRCKLNGLATKGMYKSSMESE